MWEKKPVWTIVAVLAIFSGCTTRDAAQLGSMMGRSLGVPVGTVATVIDETFQTAGDVVKENPRYQRRLVPAASPATLNPSPATAGDHYYRAEVLIKTQGPARIESMSLQKSEDVSAFWK
ncbi:hypothetical protein [Geoalkalibacter sp.]|uniref:hypothetical protein n=1 Tax=Geoalkalibacter sp. TaxID=3041440 RepID=UPI00272ECA7F|nr:hypothetical protein [Geoalkalibacter sp.]